MLWLYLHFPHLLLDHLRKSQQNQGATVIIEGASQRIAQACPQSQQLGLLPGMRLKTALSLAPDLTTAQANPERERQVLEQQACWLYRYAAQITLHPPNGLLIEVGSLQRLYGSLQACWQTLEQALSERQLTVSLALGATPKAARLCARNKQGLCTEVRSELDKQVASLTLEAADFDERTLQRLIRLGLTQLGDVFQLPATELARRLSPEILAHVQQIQGSRPDPQTLWQPPHHFRQQADFAQDIEHVQGLLFPLQHLLGELEDDLQWRQQDTDCVNLTLTHRDQPSTRISIRTSGPEHRAAAFLALMRIRFEQHPMKAPTAALTLSVTRFLPRQAPTDNDLLGENLNITEAWHALISRLQARLGSQALQRLASQADHRPEKAWSTANAAQRLPGRGHDATTHLPLRPLWLLSGPQPLQEVPDTWFSGPERISGGWWDGERVHRDYYIAQLASGQLAWVFRDVRDSWFIHGWFG